MLELVPEEVGEERPVKGKTRLSGLFEGMKKKGPGKGPNAMLELIPEAPPASVKGKTALSELFADLKKKKVTTPGPNAMLGLIDEALPAHEETPRSVRENSKAETPSSSQSSDSQNQPPQPQSEPMIKIDIGLDPSEKLSRRASGLDDPSPQASPPNPHNSLAPPIRSHIKRRSILIQVLEDQREANEPLPPTDHSGSPKRRQATGNILKHIAQPTSGGE